MAAHNEKGRQGEQLAVEYFSKMGYEILFQNWRYRHWEVDIIASKNGMLHFIEVKCRSTNAHGFPEESVTAKKLRHLIDTSAEFLYKYPEWKRIQFDILSISFPGTKEETYFCIEDVYL